MPTNAQLLAVLTTIRNLAREERGAMKTDPNKDRTRETLRQIERLTRLDEGTDHLAEFERQTGAKTQSTRAKD